MVAVQRLSAFAALDDSPDALTHAEAEGVAGDESWERWVAEYRRGDALILRLHLVIEFADKATQPLRASVGGFFVESHLHPPKLEQQVAELASGEFVTLAESLVECGLVFDVAELDAMYVHVELDLRVRRRLADIRATRLAGARRRPAPGTRFEGRRPTGASRGPA